MADKKLAAQLIESGHESSVKCDTTYFPQQCQRRYYIFKIGSLDTQTISISIETDPEFVFSVILYTMYKVEQNKIKGGKKNA